MASTTTGPRNISRRQSALKSGDSRGTNRAIGTKKCAASDEKSSGGIPVLTITPAEEDFQTIRGMLPTSDWSLGKAATLSAGLAQLRDQRPPALVICESDLVPGSWKDILSDIMSMTDPPLLIVASRLADERLWAEALNLGAYDVLAKPFDSTEVNRVLSLAWSHWQRGRHATAGNHFSVAPATDSAFGAGAVI